MEGADSELSVGRREQRKVLIKPEIKGPRMSARPKPISCPEYAGVTFGLSPSAKYINLVYPRSQNEMPYG